MKLSVIILTIGLAFIGCSKTDSHADHQHEDMHGDMAGMHMDEEANADAGKILYYTCPMASHSDVHHGEAGKCEKCGMELVPAVLTTAEEADYYGCPMPSHSHIRHEEPGKCEECGMKLMPMKIAR